MTDGRFVLDYDTNLLRFTASELYSLLCLHAAREMFGKGYFALSSLEQTAVTDAVFRMVDGNYKALGPEWLQRMLPVPPQGGDPQPPGQGDATGQRRKGPSES